MHNESRKKQSHIYIMAQAYWEKKNNMETFTQRLMIKKINKSKTFM